MSFIEVASYVLTQTNRYENENVRIITEARLIGNLKNFKKVQKFCFSTGHEEVLNLSFYQKFNSFQQNT